MMLDSLAELHHKQALWDEDITHVMNSIPHTPEWTEAHEGVFWMGYRKFQAAQVKHLLNCWEFTPANRI